MEMPKKKRRQSIPSGKEKKRRTRGKFIFGENGKTRCPMGERRGELGKKKKGTQLAP